MSQNKIMKNMHKKFIKTFIVFITLLFLFPSNVLGLNLFSVDLRSWESDPVTNESYDDIFHHNTLNSGKVWTDKSVNTSFDIQTPQQTVTANEGNNLVELSAMSQSSSLYVNATGALDVVYVLDISASMRDTMEGIIKVQAMVDATNKSIKSLMEMNPNNRVAVTAYNDYSYTLMNLQHYEGNNPLSVNIGSSTNQWTISGPNGNGTIYTGKETSGYLGGATNIQRGVITGMNILQNADTNVTIDGSIVKRTPSLVLLSDGAPTRCNGNDLRGYWIQSDQWFGHGALPYAGNGFFALITAARNKEMVTSHYGKDCNVFTIGVGLDSLDTNSKNLAKVTVDPKNHLNDNTTYAASIRGYWDQYVNDRRVNSITVGAPYGSGSPAYTDIRLGDCVTIRSGIQYNDEYYNVNNIKELDKAFEDVSDNVSETILAGEHTYPTDIGDGTDLNHQGYVTIKDEIGDYVDIKNIIGVEGNNSFTENTSFDYNTLSSIDKTSFDSSFAKRMSNISNATSEQSKSLITDAVAAGQLSSSKNYVAWYAGEKDASGKYEYLGLCTSDSMNNILVGKNAPEGATRVIKNYFFYNDTYLTSIGKEKTNLMYLNVYVDTQIKTGKQVIYEQIPASLLPITRTDLIRPNSENNKVYFASPLRLIYEVGVRGDITDDRISEKIDQEYINTHSAGTDGEFYLYTNKYDSEPAKTNATFTPNKKNDYYYFKNNMPIYSSKDANSRVSELEVGKTYYYRVIYYDIEKPDIINEDIKYEWVAFTYGAEKGANSYTSSEVEKDASGNYYIKAGTVKINDGNNYQNEKTKNVTQTASYSTNASWSEESTTALMLLGNNGRTKLKPTPTLTLEKKVKGDEDIPIPDKEFTFEIIVDSDLFKAPAGSTIEKDAAIITTDPATNEETREEIKLIFDENGKTTCTLKANQKIIIKDMEEGSDYTIKEINIPTNFTPDRNNIEGTITGNNYELITNTYLIPPLNPDLDDEVGIIGLKRIEGRDFKVGDSFSFNIKALNGAPAPKTDTITINPTSGNEFNIPFVKDLFTFTKPGSYEYEISEVIPTNGILGITYDQTVYKLTLNIEIENEQFVVKSYTLVKKENAQSSVWEDVTDNTILFVNKHKPTGILDGNTNLKVTKSFTGRDNNQWLEKDSFTFKLEGGDDLTKQAITDGKIILPSNAGGITIDKNTSIKEAIFGNITFKEAGTFKFAISEVLPEGVDASNPVKDGITYDTTVRYITVTVTLSDGNFVVSVDSSDNLTFTNVYDHGETSIGSPGDETLKVTKSFTGRPGDEWLESDIFTFTLGAYDDITKQAVINGDVVLPSNAGGITIDKDTPLKEALFGAIQFKKAGTYKFVVKEVLPDGVTEDSPNKDKITYDTSEKIITVVVTDDNNGNLTAQVESSSDELYFENKYESVVIVEDDTEFKVVKSFTGREDDKWLDSDVFTFKLEGGDTTTVQAIKDKHIILPGKGETATVTINKDTANHEALFGKLQFKKAGIYTFKITEEKGNIPGVSYDEHAYYITVEVVEDIDGNLSAVVKETVQTGSNTFVNVYKPSEGNTGDDPDTVLGGEKVLIGKTLQGGEFTFIVEALEGAPEPPFKEVTNNKDGTFNFGNITFDTPGVYKYKITEKIEGRDGYTYDGRVYIVTYTVVNNNETGKLDVTRTITVDGKETDSIIFENIYEQGDEDDSVSGGDITGEKTVTSNSGDYNLGSGDFTFYMYCVSAIDENNNEISDWPKDKIEVKNAADGSILFPEITFTKPGTYTYVVRENTSDAKPGFDYDDSIYVIVYKVYYNKDTGKLECSKTITKNGQESDIVFENIYQPGTKDITVDINGIKTLSGKDLAEGEFTFVLEGKDSAPMPPNSQITNNKDGSFDFGSINFTAPGVYEYEIKEVITDSNNGIIYDKTIYKVIVTVTEVDGELKVDVKYEKEGNIVSGIVFNNKYVPEEDIIDEDDGFIGTKILDGRDLNGNEFEFEVRDESGKVVSTGKNDKDGNIIFKDLVFEKEGTYKYTITEKSNGLGGITYDKKTYVVEIIVTDDGSGKLTAKISKITLDGKEVSSISFINKYQPKPTDVSISSLKILKDGQLKEGMFTFVLKDENGKIISKVTNKADGSINFDKLKFTTIGEYIYTLEEVKGNDKNISYDKNIYKIKVTVTDDKKGNLVAKVSFVGDSPIFTNTVISNHDKYGGSAGTSDGNNVILWISILLSSIGLLVFAIKHLKINR